VPAATLAAAPASAVSSLPSPTTADEEKPAGAAPSAADPSAAPAQQTSALSPADRLPAAFSNSLRLAAVQGEASAQYEIGRRYAEGQGVGQNLASAAEWFERAAKQGLAPAQFRLGGFYEKGLGVKKNLETARRLYSTAGQAGNAKALHNLAVLYAEGIDGKPDYQTAARWFRKAAAYGVADSQYNLAILYARGIGVEQNLTEAYRWFALAAKNGDVEGGRKRDELAAHLDPASLEAARGAIESWVPQRQPDAAVEVKTPPGGWDQAAVSLPVPPAKRRPMAFAPKLDLTTPLPAQ
jgi:localization factor PodJL